MFSKKVKIISLIFAAIMVLSCALSTGIYVSAATSEAGHIVYFDNSVTDYPQVYAYMWKDGVNPNANWPGQLMTQLTDNIWGYTITGNYDKIIFTQGDSSGQSDNLDYAGNGMLATPNDNGRFKVTWSEYTGTETLPTSATSATTATTATEVTMSTSETTDESYVVYFQNDAGWSQVCAYMWNGDGSDSNKSWPGIIMTDLGDGLYEYVCSKKYANIIFNNNNNGMQTADLTYPGNSYCYNNSTSQWIHYIPSAIKITSFDTDIKSPCYTTCDIVLSSSAKSDEGDLTYKFTATNDEGEVVLSNGASDSVVWVPSVAGDYILKVEVTDTAGNYNYHEISYTVKDATLLEKAFIKAFSNSLGTKTQLEKNTPVTFTTDAIGGNTGTGLLFYKYEITEPDFQKNIPYYTTASTYSYTPTKIGTYTIKVSVQNSVNTTVTSKYTYECVAELDEDIPTAEPAGIGDVNSDGYININDVTAIQKYLAKLIDISTEYADVNGDCRISISDATAIQLKLVNIKE